MGDCDCIVCQLGKPCAASIGPPKTCKCCEYLEEKVERLTRERDEMEEELAAILPEDVGAAEYIRALRSKTDRLTRERDEARKAAAAWKALAKRWRRDVMLCPTCNGCGLMDVVVGWKPPYGDEICEPETCGECAGTGISSWGQALREAKTARREGAREMRERAAAECDSVAAEWFGHPDHNIVRNTAITCGERIRRFLPLPGEEE